MHNETDRRASVTQLTPRPRYVYDYALVPEGEYDVCLIDDHTEVYWRTVPKLVLTWSLVTPGHMGTIVRGYYAVPKLIGRIGRHGRYSAVGRTSRLARDLAAMLGARPATLGGPFPRMHVENRIYVVEIVTVTHDAEQGERPMGAQYSRVDRVLGDAR